MTSPEPVSRFRYKLKRKIKLPDWGVPAQLSGLGILVYGVADTFSLGVAAIVGGVLVAALGTVREAGWF